MLCAIVGVLLSCKGLASVDAANVMLASGGYASITEAELCSIAALQEARATAISPETDPRSAVISAGLQHRAPALEPKSQKPTLIAIRHQSMERIPRNAIVTALPTVLRDCELVEIEVNQCDLFRDSRLIDPHAAARRQRDLEGQVATLLVQHPKPHLAYYGIAHIPLLFLAGYTLSNRRSVLLFENDRYTRGWDLLRRGGEATPLQVTGMPEEVTWGTGDVAVLFSISYRVTQAAVAEVVSARLASIELGLAQPQLDSVTSEHQLRTYARAFRQTMDRVHERLPGATGIHIFYAGPPSLAFLCGQLVSKTIHRRLVIYNYVGKDRPQYAWGLDLTRALDAPDFLLQPGIQQPDDVPSTQPARYEGLPTSPA